MKKINIICFIMGIICFSIAGYIIYNKFYKQEEIKFNKDEELKQVNNKLSEIGGSLGWLIITNGIDNQNEDGTKYSIDYNKNGKNLSFYFRNSLNDVLDFVMNSDVDRKLFFGKIRENIKQNSKKYGIDEEKFIFNDGYLEQIKGNEDCERT